MSVVSTLSKRRLGRTGLMVTELGLGGYMFTCDFGVCEDEADAIIDTAFDAGINYVDTAQMYGYGHGEELIGRALERHQDKSIHISTKVGYLDRTIVRYLNDAAYNDEAALLRAIKHSMWILRRDYVDIFYIHEPNCEAWWGDGLLTCEAPVLRVLENLKHEGVIGAIGVGGWLCDTIADCIETGRIDVALVAGGYTLINQPVKDRVIPAAKKHDVGLVMGGTFLQGLLATVQRERIQEVLRKGEYSMFITKQTAKRLMAIYDLCDEAGMSVTEMALRYILNDPNIHTIIPGAQQVSHIKSNLEAISKGPLPEDLVRRIDMINAC